MQPDHQRFMKTALLLARRNLGQTWPNPSVGALIVKDGQILAQGFTARSGRPHAEPQAIADAGAAAKGSTIYVTLEPCSHTGKTGPCAQAIIEAGIKTCVVACRDPNPKVNGGGIEMLKRAGIEVIEHVCAQEALESSRGFFSAIEKKRPYVMVKIATSLDGKITNPGTHPTRRWLTGEEARREVHLLRSQFDAIATGGGTVREDDPELNCRLPGLEDRSPQRIVFSHSPLPPQSKLAKAGNVWLMDAPIPQALEQLAEKGVTRLMVEAGQKLTSAFLQSGLADTLYWFRAPITSGEQALPAFTPDLKLDASKLHCENSRTYGDDRLEIYRL